jgi:anti-anti-sigma factor
VNSVFSISISHDAPGPCLLVTGDLDIATAPKLLERARGILDGSSPGATEPVVIDLSAVEFIDSSGLHAVLALCDELEGRVAVVAGAACMRLFALVGATDRIPIVCPSGGDST